MCTAERVALGVAALVAYAGDSIIIIIINIQSVLMRTIRYISHYIIIKR